MKLSDSDRTSFKLDVLDYEFPNYECTEPSLDMYDANWLLVQIEVTHPLMGHWTAQHPSMLTYEVQILADWLEKLDSGDKTDPILGFIEPNLSFQVLDNDGKQTVLRIFFELESRPDWSNVKPAISNDVWIEFPLSRLNLRVAIEALRSQIERYPPRCIPQD